MPGGHGTLFSPLQQTSCYYDSKYKGVEISGSIQIKSGDETSLMGAVASAGPVAVGVDASSKAFRVREQAGVSLGAHTHLVLASHLSSTARYVTLILSVLLIWCVQLAWLFQHLPHTRYGRHRIWHIWWQSILAAKEQVGTHIIWASCESIMNILCL